MKQDPYIRAIVERLAPGILSKTGFLGSDPRPLEEILDADQSAVARLGTTHEKLAQKLQLVFDRARLTLGRIVQINDRLAALYRDAKGRIPCPWGRCGTFAKGQIELIDASTAKQFIYTPLGIHMIKAHGFYQGIGSPYRFTPAQIYRLLGELARNP